MRSCATSPTARRSGRAERLLRAQVLQWLFFEQYSHEPFIAVARFIHHFLPEDSPRRAELPRLEQGGHAALRVMEQRLANHPFLVADRYTIADIALYAYTHVADEGGFDLAGYPGVRSWLDRVAAEPGHIPISWDQPASVAARPDGLP